MENEPPWNPPLLKRLDLQFGHGGEAVENTLRVRVIVYESWALQFGHGGEAVENIHNVYVLKVAYTLQFGHGGEAVENQCGYEGVGAKDQGFNSATAVMPWRTKIPSIKVQCSSGFNSATAVMPWRTGANIARYRRQSMLQFGHGGDAVENSAYWFCRVVQIGRFNSATAVMPWRT